MEDALKRSRLCLPCHLQAEGILLGMRELVAQQEAGPGSVANRIWAVKLTALNAPKDSRLKGIRSGSRITTIKHY